MAYCTDNLKNYFEASRGVRAWAAKTVVPEAEYGEARGVAAQAQASCEEAAQIILSVFCEPCDVHTRETLMFIVGNTLHACKIVIEKTESLDDLEMEAQKDSISKD
jgi:hypothetical protein